MKNDVHVGKFVFIYLLSAMVGFVGFLFSDFFSFFLEISPSIQKLKILCNVYSCTIPHQRIYTSISLMFTFYIILCTYCIYTIFYSKNEKIKFSDISNSSFNPIGKIKAITIIFILSVITSSTIFFIEFNENGEGLKFSIKFINYLIYFIVTYLFCISINFSLAIFFKYNPIISAKGGR